MEKENPSIQSIQTTYRSMQSVVPSDHAPSLLSMHSAQTSFDQSRPSDGGLDSSATASRDATLRNGGDVSEDGGVHSGGSDAISHRNGISMQSLKHSFAADDCSPHNTMRLRKISQATASHHTYPRHPPKSLSKLSVSGSITAAAGSKASTPSAEQPGGGGNRQMTASTSQPFPKKSSLSTTSPPTPSSSTAAPPNHPRYSASQQQLTQPDLPPPPSQRTQSFSKPPSPPSRATGVSASSKLNLPPATVNKQQPKQQQLQQQQQQQQPQQQQLQHQQQKQPSSSGPVTNGVSPSQDSSRVTDLSSSGGGSRPVNWSDGTPQPAVVEHHNPIPSHQPGSQQPLQPPIIPVAAGKLTKPPSPPIPPSASTSTSASASCSQSEAPLAPPPVVSKSDKKKASDASSSHKYKTSLVKDKAK